MLDPDRQPDHVVGDTGELALLGAELHVRGRSRVHEQGLGVTDVGDVAGQPGAVDQGLTGFKTALDPEHDHRSRALGQLTLGDFVVAVVGHVRVPDPGDGFVVGEEVEHGAGVGNVPLHAQRQRLHALDQVKRALRGQHGAEVAQALGAGAGDEGRGAEVLGVGHARVAGIGLGQGRELVRGRPVEVTRIDDETAHGDAVTADPLGRRVDDDIGAVLERAVERRRGEGAVDHQRQARFLRHPSDGGDVEHVQTGVADDLAEDHAGIGLDRGAYGVDVRAIDEGGGDAKARQGQLHQVDRPAVERLGRHDMIAC